MTELNTILNAIHDITENGLKNQLDVNSLGVLLQGYLKFCGGLPYSDPDTIRRAQGILGRAIILHAHQACPVYGDLIVPEHLASTDCLKSTAGKFLLAKGDLMDKSRWFTGTFSAIDNKTSGTTGEPFHYRIWEDAYFPIEKDHHYKLILNEFGITKPVVLHLTGPGMAVSGFDKIKSGSALIQVADKSKFNNPFTKLVVSHGSDPEGDYHHIVFDSDAFLNVYDYFHAIIEYMQKHKVNVLLASGGFFELFTTFMISDDATSFPKLVDLLSNTGDHMNVETLEFLKETGVAKDWCDHMRCWDGGASFFTCKNGTYHVQDELSYVYTASDGRLASVDFFSYPSPFINYTNGDYCTVSDDYDKCACGRWHRPFQFHARRPRQHQNANGGYYDTQEVVKTLLSKYPLGFVSTQDGSVSIEDSMLDEATKKDIVEEMAKLFVMVHFFTSPMLSEMQRNVTGPGGIKASCEECYGLSCVYTTKGGGGYYCSF